MTNCFHALHRAVWLSAWVLFFLAAGSFAQDIAGSGPDDASFSALSACGAFDFEGPEINSSPQIHSAIANADLNHDAVPDVVLAIPDSDLVSVYIGNNDGTLQAERNFPAGDSPQGLALGDFNNDGNIDIAVSSKFDQKLNILDGDASGNFVPSAAYPIPGTVTRLAARDLDNDGWLDLAVGSTGLRLLFGSRDGFTPGPYFTTPQPVTNVAASDFNGDGFGDLAVTFAGQNTEGGVRIYLGAAGRTFTEGITATDTTRYESVGTGDFNNDGKEDVIALGERPSSGNQPARLIVLLGNGTGGFTALPHVDNVLSVGMIAVGDFNRDGKLDFATGYSAVYLGVGDGTFNFTGGLFPIVFSNGVTAADFNGDGVLDLAQSNGWRFRLYTYFGKGDGRFSVPKWNIPDVFDTVAADFNGDGRLDLANTRGNGTTYLQLQDASGGFVTFGDGPIFSTGSSTVTNANTMVAEDFNRDGKPDLAIPVPVFNTIQILLNLGSGQFSSIGVGLGLPSQRPEVVRSGDFNNDTFIDLVVLNRNSSNFTILLGDGNGGFAVQSEQGATVSVSPSSSSMRVADFDLDGKQDIVLSRGNNNIYIYKGNGNGTFATSQVFVMPRPVLSIDVADFDGNGRPDLGLISRGNPVSYFMRALNSANGVFNITTYQAPASASGLVTADFDRDGKLDVIVGGEGFPQNVAGFYHGDGQGSFSQVQEFETFGERPFSSADFSGDGVPDLGSIGAVSYNKTTVGPCLSINDVSVAEPNTGTTAAAFTVTLSAASLQTVTASYRVVGRNAAAGQDYNEVTGTVTFEPGTLSQTIEVPVRGDIADEFDEVFNVQLSNPVNASLVDAQGKGTIIDNDAAPNASVADVSVNEGSGGASQLTFVVSLSAPSGKLTRISYATLNGTAVSPADYTGMSDMLAIEPGVLQKQIVIPVNADSLVEPNESFSLILSQPSGLILTDANAVATLINDDIGGTVQFSSNTYSVFENAGSAVVTVNRTGGNAGGVAVQFTMTDGLAVAGQDYTAVNTTLTFAANETTKTVSIPILNDTIDEEDVETARVFITNVTGGGTLAFPAAAVINIQDNDPVPSMVALDTAVVESDSGNSVATVTVQLSAASAREVRVNFATADGTATASSDYVPTTGTLIFAPGQTSRTFPVTIIGSTLGPDETIRVLLSNAINSSILDATATITITNDERGRLFDYDGDGRADLSVRRPSSNVWHVLGQALGYSVLEFGVAGDRMAPADYDGDGRTDIAVFRPSNGAWYIFASGTGTFQTFIWGADGDQPVPTDRDGDGKADLVLFRPSNNTWYTRFANGTFAATVFGETGDKPMLGDFDGDGIGDIALFRPSDNNWYILKSSLGFFIQTWGETGDIPVTGDFDGDGATDQVVFRLSTGEWFLSRTTLGFGVQSWGQTGDVPIPADYDGDGKTDIAVFRPSSGTWYIVQSRDGIRIQQFGQNGDVPTPSAFIF